MGNNSKEYKIGDIVEMKYSSYGNKKSYWKIVWIDEKKFAILRYDIETKKEAKDSHWFTKWEFSSIEEELKIL